MGYNNVICIIKSMNYRLLLSFFLIMVGSTLAISQVITVSGKVKDAETGDPVPFANVIFQGTQLGTTTSFDGDFELTANQVYDSITVSYVGYESLNIAISRGAQILEIKLEPNVIRLNELIVYPGENPAWEVMRNVVKNKKVNDKRKLDAYQYEGYTKIEIDIDNMSEKFRSRKVVQKATAVLDSIQTIAGENGKPILPIFFSEALSDYYVKNNPFLRHEYILKTNVTGLGLTDGTFTSQIVGATFQEYNFYKNFLTILEKEFVSPIAGSWKGYYEYDLVDSVMVGEDFCYRIDYFPKRKHDLAFTGTIWITKEHYALKQIDATIVKSANLNFVEKIRVQQELIATEAGPWLPKKTRVLVDIAQFSVESAGLLAKFYTSIDKIVVNDPKEDDFYRIPVEMDTEVRQSDEQYWSSNRHESLSQTEVNVYNMVDTLKRIPVIKAYSDIVKMAYSGYHKLGKFDIGPYPLFLSLNDVEGLRLGFGAETNYSFSKRFVLKGYAGYGFKDEKWKYAGGVDYIASRRPWLKMGVEVSREVDPVYLLYEPIIGQVAFYAFTRLGSLRRPFYHDKYQFSLVNQIARDVNLRLWLRNDFLEPLFDFNYYTQPDQDPSSIRQNLTATEIKVELEWAKDRKYLINDNYRYHSGFNRFPVVTLRYTAGLKGVMGSDFAYNKVGLNIKKKFKLGSFGTSMLILDGEYIFGVAPYPLLENHLGNESPFYADRAYSLMDNFEFTSDHYASVGYRHHFNGLIMNRIPLIKYLKLRLFGEARVLIGGVRQENIDVMVPQTDNDGNPVPHFKSLSETPYVELAYGVENIMKIIQVVFVHRFSDASIPGNDDANRFGIRIGFDFTL